MTRSLLCALGSLAAFALLVWRVLPRRGDPRRTLAQLLIVALYRWARWWSCLAVGADRGYLAYRMEMRCTVVAPENEGI